MTSAWVSTADQSDAKSAADRPRAIPLGRVTLRGREYDYVREAIESGHIAGNGPFTKRVEGFIAKSLGAPRVLLTHSCTAALEIAALLTFKPGDEVILPSFTFASAAGAFARCGARLVFADIDAETLNLDPQAVAAAVTPKTRAIVAMHYAGAGMRPRVARRNRRRVERGADRGRGARLRREDIAIGRWAASVRSRLSAFMRSKNVTSGRRRRAVIVNDPALVARAQIIRDRGTDREQFLRRRGR